MGKISSKFVVLAAAFLFTFVQVSASPITIAELEDDCSIDSVESVIQELLAYDVTENLFEEEDILIGYNLEEDLFNDLDDDIADYMAFEEDYTSHDYIAEEQMLENYMLSETEIAYEDSESIISELESENLIAFSQDIPIAFAADLEE